MSPDYTVPVKAEPEKVDIPQTEPLRLECEHFLQCMTNGQRPETDGEEGLRVLRILNASQWSLDNDGQKIEIGGEKTEHGSKEDERVGSLEGKRYFVHETAVIDDNVVIGKGTKIWHFSHVLAHSTLGENCNVGQNVVIGPDVSIGKGCKIQNNVSVFKGVTLEDGVFCGPSMVFTNIYNPRAEIRKMDQVRPTLVKHGATLGANCTIVCGTTIGRYAFIGAGAVVTHNVPDHALMLGNPARRVGWMCQCGERLTDDLDCLACGNKYQKDDSGLKRIFGQD